jgi:hypothetical protein
MQSKIDVSCIAVLSLHVIARPISKESKKRLTVFEYATVNVGQLWCIRIAHDFSTSQVDLVAQIHDWFLFHFPGNSAA